MIRRPQQPGEQVTQKRRGSRVIGIGLAVGRGEKARAVAEHFLEEQPPAAIETLGGLIPDTQREEQQRKQEDRQGLLAKVFFVDHRSTTRNRLGGQIRMVSLRALNIS